MTHIWQGLRSGQWLTPARIRGYSLILLGVCAMVMVGWVAVSDGLIDRNGKPLGTDFSNVYAAGTLTWQGRPAEAYVPALQHAAEKASFGGREVRLAYLGLELAPEIGDQPTESIVPRKPATAQAR